MRLQPLKISRPDLREEVGKLVRRVCAHGPGQRLPLEELLRVLGVRVAPAFHTQLLSRGDLILHEDRFENDGPPIERKVRLLGFDVNLDIGAHLRGQIHREEGSFSLRFTSGASVTATKLFFRIELRTIQLHPDHIAVHFEGAQDLHISLA